MKQNYAKSYFILPIVLLSMLSNAVHGKGLPAPSAQVILTISGNLSYPNVGNEVHLDLPTLKSLPVTEFTSYAPGHSDIKRFTGVRVSTLLEQIGSDSRDFVAIGLDGFKFTITDFDFDYYPIIIAYLCNGKEMTIRTLGPLFLTMPFDDYPELLTHTNKSSSVWQLTKIELL